MTLRLLVAQSAIVACCLALAAFPQQASRPDQVTTAPAKHSASLGSKTLENSGIYEVGGNVLPPKAIHISYPGYTQAAKRARLEGDCILSLVVDTKGKPQNVYVKKAFDKGLDKNAMKAVKRYRFEPGTLDGKPVAVEINVDVKFRIY